MTRDVDRLIAPDSFKGTYTAREVALALATGARAEHAAVTLDLCPVADGGEGTLDIVVRELGGRTLEQQVSDPLGRPVAAGFGWIDEGSRALVEVAGASGLGLVAVSERDAEAASTFGTGELIAAAVATGASRVTVAAGGSAGTDGGAGAIRAIDSAGEGRLDAQTLEGKAVGEIARRCARARVPFHAVVGSVALDADQSDELRLASVRRACELSELRSAGRELAATACSA